MNTACIIATLATMATASQELLFKDAGSSRLLKDDTNTFAPGYNHEGEVLNDAAIFGFVVGFLVYGGFLLFATIMLIRDGINRNKMYADLVQERKDTLKNTYKCTDEDIAKYEQEFKEQDARKDAKKDDDAISMVN